MSGLWIIYRLWADFCQPVLEICLYFNWNRNLVMYYDALHVHLSPLTNSNDCTQCLIIEIQQCDLYFLVNGKSVHFLSKTRLNVFGRVRMFQILWIMLQSNFLYKSQMILSWIIIHGNVEHNDQGIGWAKNEAEITLLWAIICFVIMLPYSNLFFVTVKIAVKKVISKRGKSEIIKLTLMRIHVKKI